MGQSSTQCKSASMVTQGQNYNTSKKITLPKMTETKKYQPVIMQILGLVSNIPYEVLSVRYVLKRPIFWPFCSAPPASLSSGVGDGRRGRLRWARQGKMPRRDTELNKSRYPVIRYVVRIRESGGRSRERQSEKSLIGRYRVRRRTTAASAF